MKKVLFQHKSIKIIDNGKVITFKRPVTELPLLGHINKETGDWYDENHKLICPTEWVEVFSIESNKTTRLEVARMKSEWLKNPLLNL